MVFNATFNNISGISWWSVLLVEETGVPGENHREVSEKKIVKPFCGLNRPNFHSHKAYICGYHPCKQRYKDLNKLNHK